MFAVATFVHMTRIEIVDALGLDSLAISVDHVSFRWVDTLDELGIAEAIGRAVVPSEDI